MIKLKVNKAYSRHLSLVLATLLILITLVGCASSENSSTSDRAGTTEASPASQKPYDTSQESYDKDNGSGLEKSKSQDNPSVTSSPNPKSNLQTGHKIIQTGQISLETVKFDETINSVQNYVNSIGGYLQSSSVQGKGIATNNVPSKRHGSFTARVPQSKYSEFFTSIKGYGTITYQESKGDDVTEQYFDTEARVKSLITQEERILDILKKTDKLTDVIELERRLSEIRYQIDSLTGTLKKWDNLVNFSTITLEIQEVEEVTKVAPEKSNGLLKRITYGFTNSVKQLGVFLQSSLVLISTILPFLVVVMLIALAILYIIKKYNKPRNNSLTNSSSDDSKDDNNSENNSENNN